MDYASQVRRLVERGLLISDLASTEHFLSYCNYYRFTGRRGDRPQRSERPLGRRDYGVEPMPNRSLVKTGPAATRPVLVSTMREDPKSRYPAWALRELLMNAVIHRDYFLGNAPVKFYEYRGSRIEISNPGGLFGRAKPDNFPFVNDYRNPLLAEAMKVLGMVNKYNRGIAKVNRELEKNGNPAAQFDVNRLTEFRVTIRARPESGTIKPESGTIKPESGEINPESGEIKPESGTINPESGTIKPESGTINGAQLYNTESQDRAVLDVVRHSPGIKKDAIFLKVKTSSRSVQRSLERLCSDKKIEYRGSKKTGGWYVRT